MRSSSRQSVHVRSPQAAELAARCRKAGATVRAGSTSRVAAAPVAGPDAGTGPDVIEITGMDSAEVGKLAAAAFLSFYRAHPGYGNRSVAGRVAAELAPLAGLQAGTGRTYIAGELRKLTGLAVARSPAEENDDQAAG